MLSEAVHQGILRKFEALKGETLVGKKPIKGDSKDQRVPADMYVDEEHILHDLIRGFYKPAGMPYLISYQATESDDNYGQQIIWSNKDVFEFETIEMRPPSSPKDNRKKSDIAAARYNLEHQIPIGILYKQSKGVNVVLGLGMIIAENKDGNFIVKPYSSPEKILEIIKKEVDHTYEINPDFVSEVVREVSIRRGQNKFKAILKNIYSTCALCNITNEHTIASHIKPWRDSTVEERLDKYNGLLLCPNHDHLFDKGFISFDSTGHIVISKHLPENLQREFKVHSKLKIELSHDQKKKYMEYHLNNIFKSK